MCTRLITIYFLVGGLAHGALLQAFPMLYTSSNGAFTLCVFPAKYRDPHRPQETDHRLVRAFAENPHCVAALFSEWPEKHAKFTKRIIILPNRIAPNSALVANSGEYFATFGEWGLNNGNSLAICIFDAQGNLIKSLQVKDLFTKETLSELPATAEFIYWGRPVGFDDKEQYLLVDLWAKGYDMNIEKMKHRRISISLKSGEISNAQKER